MPFQPLFAEDVVEELELQLCLDHHHPLLSEVVHKVANWIVLVPMANRIVDTFAKLLQEIIKRYKGARAPDTGTAVYEARIESSFNLVPSPLIG